MSNASNHHSLGYHGTSGSPLSFRRRSIPMVIPLQRWMFLFFLPVLPKVLWNGNFPRHQSPNHRGSHGINSAFFTIRWMNVSTPNKCEKDACQQTMGNGPPGPKSKPGGSTHGNCSTQKDGIFRRVVTSQWRWKQRQQGVHEGHIAGGKLLWYIQSYVKTQTDQRFELLKSWNFISERNPP